MQFAPTNWRTIGYCDDAVDVVGHDDEFPQFHIGADFRGIDPFVMGDDPKFIQCHFSVFDCTKSAYSILATDGYEIQSFQ